MKNSTEQDFENMLYVGIAKVIVRGLGASVDALVDGDREKAAKAIAEVRRVFVAYDQCLQKLARETGTPESQR